MQKIIIGNKSDLENKISVTDNDVKNIINSNLKCNGIISAKEYLKKFLTEEETELIRRARNVPVAVGRRNNQQIHHQATAFEVLIGYLYLENKERLHEIFSEIEKFMQKA